MRIDEIAQKMMSGGEITRDAQIVAGEGIQTLLALGESFETPDDFAEAIGDQLNIDEQGALALIAFGSFIAGEGDQDWSMTTKNLGLGAVIGYKIAMKQIHS